MAFLFPRVAYGPVARCGYPAAVSRSEFAPLFSLFDDSLAELQKASRHHARKTFNPRFDVKEAKEAYSVEAELPGVDQKDLTIEFTDEHTLTIKGRTERTSESGTPPTAVEAAPEKPAVEDAPSEKSHQPTVEDEAQTPANASAAAESEKSTEAAATPAETTTTEAPQEPARAKQHYWISERRVGEFSRSFSFPARVDQDAVTASLKNGVLSVVVPKAPVPESRRINIE